MRLSPSAAAGHPQKGPGWPRVELPVQRRCDREAIVGAVRGIRYEAGEAVRQSPPSTEAGTGRIPKRKIEADQDVTDLADD